MCLREALATVLLVSYKIIRHASFVEGDGIVGGDGHGLIGGRRRRKGLSKIQRKIRTNRPRKCASPAYCSVQVHYSLDVGLRVDCFPLWMRRSIWEAKPRKGSFIDCVTHAKEQRRIRENFGALCDSMRGNMKCNVTGTQSHLRRAKLGPK